MITHKYLARLLSSNLDIRHSTVRGVTVELSQGIIQGKVGSTVSGVAFYSFQGIPYAEPPVGELRFKAPQGAPSWEGVKDASSVGSSCRMSEDCLYINVYSPQ
ncbi:unnamed protein product, partial [Timema podura]|nr:unnamed protein product [Timema podura]